MNLLKISQRTKKSLLSGGINTPEELSSKSKDELLAMEGVGEKAVTEINKALGKIGLSLRE